jgi:hypothetical protein
MNFDSVFTFYFVTIRIVVCLETEEESGSDSLLYLLEEMKQHIMTPSVCVCLDSGVMDFKRLWLTTSLR